MKKETKKEGRNVEQKEKVVGFDISLSAFLLEGGRNQQDRSVRSLRLHAPRMHLRLSIQPNVSTCLYLCMSVMESAAVHLSVYLRAHVFICYSHIQRHAAMEEECRRISIK